MKTHSITHCFASAGTSRTLTIWLPWPWMEWRWAPHCYLTPALLSTSSTVVLSWWLCAPSWIFGDSFGDPNLGRRAVLLASGEQRPGMLLPNFQCTGQPPNREWSDPKWQSCWEWATLSRTFASLVPYHPGLDLNWSLVGWVLITQHKVVLFLCCAITILYIFCPYIIFLLAILHVDHTND